MKNQLHVGTMYIGWINEKWNLSIFGWRDLYMNQGNLHIVDNDFKFTTTWELPDLPKSTEPHLNQSVDFISDRRFLF